MVRRRPFNVFSLSFLDCICCGFGAVILLFVIINSKEKFDEADPAPEPPPDLRGEVNRLQHEVLDEKKNRVVARNALEKSTAEKIRMEGRARELLALIQEKREELASFDKTTLSTKEHINRLKSDMESMEEELKRLEAGAAQSREEEGRNLRSFKGTGDRQYLTGLKLGGKRILILVDGSASMLGSSLVDVIIRRNLPDERKLQSPKWQQAIGTVDWVSAHFKAQTQYQIIFFNEQAHPLLEAEGLGWRKASDLEQLNRAIEELHGCVAEKGTSLINAFKVAKSMDPKPDNIILITDGLPTMGAKRGREEKVSGTRRLRLFQDAIKELPGGIPVNVILLPMDGDPMAASAFWKLTLRSRGSFLCPSSDWP